MAQGGAGPREINIPSCATGLGGCAWGGGSSAMAAAASRPIFNDTAGPKVFEVGKVARPCGKISAVCAVGEG